MSIWRDALFTSSTRSHSITTQGHQRDSTLPFAEQFGFSEQKHFGAGVDLDLGASELGKEYLVARFDAARDDFSLVVDGAGADGNHRCVVDLKFVGDAGLDIHLPSVRSSEISF